MVEKERRIETMNKKDFVQFSKIMYGMAIAFESEIPEERLELYFSFLDDFSIDQFRRAAEFLIETRVETPKIRGFPSIAEIRTATLGSAELKAIQAWGKVMAKIGDVDHKFDDPLIARSMEMVFGNVENFYTGDPRSDMADRVHFIKAYQLLFNLEEVKKERKRLKGVKFLKGEK